jgi:hypothetical protein
MLYMIQKNIIISTMYEKKTLCAQSELLFFFAGLLHFIDFLHCWVQHVNAQNVVPR